MVPNHQLLSPSKEQRPLVDQSWLVDGINPAFLAMRAILPIGVDDDRLVCAVADPGDVDAQAAIAFASGRSVIAVETPRDTILAAIGTPVAVPPTPSPPANPGVRHAEAVLLLRRHLTEAIQAGADTLRISRGRDTVSMELAERAIRCVEMTPAAIRVLIDAANALCVPNDSASFVVSIAGERRQATIETTPDGPLIRFGAQAGQNNA